MKIDWKKFGKTGSDVCIGPVRCAVWRRGDHWVSEASWGLGSMAFWQERRTTEEAARSAAVEVAERWIRDGIVNLTAALGNKS